MHFLFSKIQNQMREKKILYIYEKREKYCVYIWTSLSTFVCAYETWIVRCTWKLQQRIFRYMCIFICFSIFFCGSAAFLHSLSLSHTIRFGFSFVCLRIGIAYNIHIYNYYDCFFRLVPRVIGHSVFMNITSQKKEKWFEHQIHNMHKR